MRSEKRHSYRFKAFRLEVEERRLLCHDRPVPLTPKAFDVLVELVEQSGHLVEKEELLQSVWSDSFVEEANIARLIHTLRKTLGDDGSDNKFIETVPKKGYRFVAKVRCLKKETETAFDQAAARRERQQNPPKLPPRADQPDARPTGNAAALSNRRHAAVENETPPLFTLPLSADSAELINAPRLFSAQPTGENAAATTGSDDFTHLTRRRRGRRRGLRFSVYGLGVGFFFLVLQQILRIFGFLLLNDQNGLLLGASKDLATLTIDSLMLVQIPVGLGFFSGIGLFLFGIARAIYALFEKEDSRIKPALIERLIVVLIVILILAVAVPNLIFSYRQAHRPAPRFPENTIGDTESR